MAQGEEVLELLAALVTLAILCDGPMGQVAHKNGCRTAEPTESCRFVGPLRSTVASQLQTANFATWGPFQLQRFDWN